MTDKNIEKRKFVRKFVTVKFSIADEVIDASVYFDTRDISLGGIFIESDLLLDIGEEIELKFPSPINPEQSFTIKGRVARTIKGKNPYDRDSVPGMGVQFINLDEKKKRALLSLMNQAGLRK
jgi:c-di-GMP-binding flagellar brake protein YcgR